MARSEMSHGLYGNTRFHFLNLGKQLNSLYLVIKTSITQHWSPNLKLLNIHFIYDNFLLKNNFVIKYLRVY